MGRHDAPAITPSRHLVLDHPRLSRGVAEPAVERHQQLAPPSRVMERVEQKKNNVELGRQMSRCVARTKRATARITRARSRARCTNGLPVRTLWSVKFSSRRYRASISISSRRSLRRCVAYFHQVKK